MLQRSLPATFSPDVVAQIDGRLAEIASAHRVALPLAVESGSRAWGFPSPDSDYDCRFVFVRRMDDYLTPWRRRDVIETPLTPVLDVNGWDLAKALQLLLRGNAVVIEWLTSPVVYGVDPPFRADFLDLAASVCDRHALARHYLHVGRRHQADFGRGAAVRQKRIFYALRPAAVLRWLEVNPTSRAPPMHLPTLLDGCDTPVATRRLVDDLIARKAQTSELGEGPLPVELAAFIDREFEAATTRLAVPPLAQTLSDAGRQSLAEDFFRKSVQRLGAG